MAGFKAGDAFFICDNLSKEKGHLHVALCAPYGQPLVVLVVICNTKTIETDNTLILDRDDHSFIKHPTAVSFDYLKPINVAPLVALEASGRIDLFKRYEPVSPELLKRMVQGALTSDMTPKRMKTLLMEQHGITDEE
ncbi:MAG: hypothetical protein JWL77_4471 [Chthonomonadaceae bacterium]|nr:hypothetical protein [Chthonomonadaceae bacterium]